MASHLKGVAKSTMSDQIRKELCEYKRDNPASTQKDLQRWLEGKLELKHQERVNITGELILQKARDTMKLVYPHDDSNFNFSIGWLGKFKHRHGIKSFHRFGESGFVDVQDMEQKLVSIREKIDKFPMKDVFNMDETGLFYRLQADNSLATKQLEGRKQDKERLTVVIYCNEDSSEKIPLWIIGKYAKPHCFKNVNMNSLDSSDIARNLNESTFDEETQDFETMINQCGYRNKMDIDNLMNYPEDDGKDDTVPLEHVTRKEALMASNTLHNFMIQYKNTTPELLDAIRKARDELQIDLNFKGKQKTIESYFNRV
ncbi:CENP-B 2 [Glycine max]|nr:CENP-B 2 [Glycine max]